MGDAGARARQDGDLLVVEPDAVREHGAGVEQPERVEVADHRAAVAVLDVGTLGAGLGGVGAEEPAVRLGEPLRRLQVLGADGVGAVREGAGEHVVGAGELGEERLGVGEALGAAVDAGAVEEDAAGRHPDADCAGGGDGLARVPEHVHRRRHPAERQLGEAEGRAEAHGVAVQDRAFGLPDRPEPGLERQVLDEAAEQAVAGVAVRVDEARHQEHAAGVDHLPGVAADRLRPGRSGRCVRRRPPPRRRGAPCRRRRRSGPARW